MMSRDLLRRAGLGDEELDGGALAVRSPIDGAEIARLPETAPSDMPAVIAGFWRRIAASNVEPLRGRPEIKWNWVMELASTLQKDYK